MPVLIAFALLIAAAVAAEASPKDNQDVRMVLLDTILREPLTLRGPESRPEQRRAAHELADNHPAAHGPLGVPIALHRLLISPQDGDPCTFTPSCSEYALEAVRRHGVTGWVLASDRLLRCHRGNWGDYAHAHGHNLDPLAAEPRTYGVDASRALTGGLLSILPGLGQMAAGRWADGLNALATIGVLGMGTAAYAHRDQPVPAALLGSATAFFYVGNLYGGAVAHGRTTGP